MLSTCGSTPTPPLQAGWILDGLMMVATRSCRPTTQRVEYLHGTALRDSRFQSKTKDNLELERPCQRDSRDVMKIAAEESIDHHQVT